jgi:hypothetical protein
MRTTHILKSLSLTSQRRPRRGPLLRHAPEHVRLLLRPTFPDLPVVEPAHPCNTLDQFFHAVGAGYVDSVIHWLDNRLSNWRPIDEAALDLAIQKKQFPIAELLLDQLQYEEKIQEAIEQQNPYPSSDLYSRVTVECENKHHFNILLFETFMSGKASITLCYNTPLMKPYLEPLIPFCNSHFDDRMYFNFYITDEPASDIYMRAYKILHCLESISGRQLDCVYTALDEFFVDARLGFPGGNYFARHGSVHSNQSSKATYVDYQMYRAAWNLDYNAMLSLLRSGANPNATFDGNSILYYLAMHGTDKVFSKNELERSAENYQAALDMVEMLLQYGADPGTTTHGKTVIEKLAYYEQAVIKEEKKRQLYRDIIKRLSAANVLTAPTPVHPSVAALPLSQVILTVNDIMEKRRNKKSYIKNIASYTTPASTMININTDTGNTVRVESKKLSLLSPNESEEIYNFFLQEFVLPTNENPEKYWKTTLTPNNGEIFVDIVRQRDEVIGFVLTEIMDQAIEKMPTIFYSKFAIGRLSQYPGLMKLLMLARNFADSKREKLGYAFYEAASSGGFAICGDIKQFPAYVASGEAMPNLIKRVYGANQEILIENGVWYAKDPIVAVHDDADEAEFKNPSVLLRKTFRKVYQKPGYTLLMCFENSDENRQALVDSLAPLVGTDNITKILNIFSPNPEPKPAMLHARL